jgi:hypothetical protein
VVAEPAVEEPVLAAEVIAEEPEPTRTTLELEAPIYVMPPLVEQAPRVVPVAPRASAAPAKPTRNVAPVFVGDTAIDPMSLRPSLTLRAGLDSVKVDGEQITVRNKASRERVPWSDVVAFETYIEGDPTDPDARGYLIVRTIGDAIDLPATRGNVTELEHAHAVLEAYRLRANAPRPN